VPPLVVADVIRLPAAEIAPLPVPVVTTDTVRPAVQVPTATASSVPIPVLLNGTTTDDAVAKAASPPPVGDPPAVIRQRMTSAASVGPASTAPLPVASEAVPPARAATVPPPELVTGSLPSPPPPLPKVTTLTPRAPAVSRPSAQPAAAAAVVSTGPVGIQLGNNASLDEARAVWMITSERNRSLQNLEPRVVQTDAFGSRSFKLMAGPIASRAEAAKVCAELRSNGVVCRISGYAGQPL
jgi:hypothetical protein